MKNFLHTAVFLLIAVYLLPIASSAQVIAGGGQHNLAVCNDNTVMSWGYNYSGELGTGTTGSSTIPVSVINLTGIASVASGWEHSIALRSDSTVWAWGYNGYGQLGNGSIVNSNFPVQTNNLSSVISIGWGHLHTHTLAVKNDGSAWTWGKNTNGQLGDNSVAMRTTPIQVHGLNNVGYLTNVIRVAGGHDFSLALKSDGTAWSWGANSFSQLGDSTTIESHTPVQVRNINSLTAVAVGDWSCLALKSDSTVWAWGYNGSGRLGDNTTVSRSTPVQVLGENGIGFLNNIVTIAAGESHELALRKDGSVWAWGKNFYGELGDSSNTDRWTPVQVRGENGIGFLYGIVAIAGGARHSLALRNDGTLFSWGDNANGQLGDGTYVERHVPVQVTGLCSVPTSANEMKEQFSITVFPNPAINQFTVYPPRDGLTPENSLQFTIKSIEIYNMIGEKVYHKQLTIDHGQLTIDVSNLRQGIYFVSVEGKDFVTVKKLVVGSW